MRKDETAPRREQSAGARFSLIDSPPFLHYVSLLLDIILRHCIMCCRRIIPRNSGNPRGEVCRVQRRFQPLPRRSRTFAPLLGGKKRPNPTVLKVPGSATGHQERHPDGTPGSGEDGADGREVQAARDRQGVVVGRLGFFGICFSE